MRSIPTTPVRRDGRAHGLLAALSTILAALIGAAVTDVSGSCTAGGS
jgi:hypothetical protein